MNSNLYDIELTKEKSEVLISIIVPVYNTAQWLPELFESLLDQGLGQDEYEIICVNDGSTDNSLEVLERYARDNRCIRIISQENARQAAARNAGLREACGRYVWFVDSDDYLDSGALKFVVSIMDEHKIDELTVGMKSFLGEGSTYIHKKNEFTYAPLRKMPELATCSGVKIFRRDIIEKNKIEWNKELALCDDVLFLYTYELFSKKNVAVSEPSYYYRQRVDSTSHSHSEAVLDKHLFSVMLLGEEYIKILKAPPCEMTKKQLKNLKARINLCIQTALYDLAIKGDEELTAKIVSEYKSRKLYPYKFIWSNLKPKISLKRTLYDGLMFLFPIEFLYKRIGKRLNKKYNKKYR